MAELERKQCGQKVCGTARKRVNKIRLVMTLLTKLGAMLNKIRYGETLQARLPSSWHR